MVALLVSQRETMREVFPQDICNLIFSLSINKSLNLCSVPVDTAEDKVEAEEERMLSFQFLEKTLRADHTETAVDDTEITGVMPRRVFLENPRTRIRLSPVLPSLECHSPRSSL